MKIEIWSDFVCPFCYLGEKRFELGLEQFEGKEDVEISFRSFQLDPNAVSAAGKSIDELIAHKYGMSVAQAKANNDNIVSAAAAVGLHYDFDNLKHNNTGKAHEIAKFAFDKGLEKSLVDRFFKAYFEEGTDIGDVNALVTLAASIGLDPEEVTLVLEEGRYSEAVKKDQAEAAQLGISGVPFFVIDGKFGVSGAQSPEHFTMALREASKAHVAL